MDWCAGLDVQYITLGIYVVAYEEVTYQSNVIARMDDGTVIVLAEDARTTGTDTREGDRGRGMTGCGPAGNGG